MDKNLFLPAAGVALTLGFLASCTGIFETLYYDNEFSNEMYNLHLYLPVAFLLVAWGWGAAALFYYVVNSVSFSRWYHWLLTLVLTSGAATASCYAYTSNCLADAGMNFNAQLAGFSIIMAMLEAILFTIGSFSMRWWSSNCRHTPFPE